MRERPELTFSSITERDVDLLLVEELKCSEGFLEWFLTKALGRAQWRERSSFRVRHSVPGVGKHAGETDIEVSFTASGNRVALLIENKVDAPFQPDQAQRYALRARELVERHKCDESLTVLFAPSGYLKSDPMCQEFSAVVPYEDLVKFLKEQSHGSEEQAQRYGHRSEMLKQAVERWRRGYVAETDAALTKFWAEYYSLARAEAPFLKMERPGDKPLNSTWVSFNRSIRRLPGLPLCELWHKWPYGLVDLQFSGLAVRYDAFGPIVDPLLGPGMTLRQAGKSLAVSIDVPELDGAAEFQPQREAATQGLAAASRLRAWYAEHAASLAKALRSILRGPGDTAGDS